MAELFRKAALDRLSEPERLDRALSVVSARRWLALCTLGALVAALVTWSVLGRVSSYVRASGILLDTGGTVVDAVATDTGTLTDILVRIGQSVEKGEVVANATNRELTERYRSALAMVEESERTLDDLKTTFKAEDELFKGNMAKQQARLEQSERIGRQAVDTARERLESHRQLYEERVITRVTLERSQQAYDRALQELFETVRRRETQEARELTRLHEYNTRLNSAETRLREMRLRARELQARLDAQRILAPVSGAVIETKATIGSVLLAGQSALSIKTGSGEKVEVLMYIPPADGKRVEPGMDVLVSPTTTEPETHGFVKGVVESVSQFPVSISGIVAVLQNQELAQTFSQSGPPYVSRVRLLPDPSTESGFVWTTKKGEDEPLVSGTLASIDIRTESERPIALVIPLLRKLANQ